MPFATPTVRVTLVADTHLGFDLPENPRVERRRRGDDFFANYGRVLDHVARTRPHLLVHGGDVFFRSRVAPAIVDRAFAALAAVADLGVQVVVVPGNHERSRLPPSLWLTHPNVHVFHKPGAVVLQANGVDVAVAGFPFARGDVRGAFRGILDETGIERVPAGVRLLCMHQTVSGAKVGPDGFTFRSGPDVIPGGSVPAGLTAVLAGHIHRAQTLGGGAGAEVPVFYAGSIERTSFAERNEPKGFFDLTIGAPDRGPARVVAADFIELPARPMTDIALPSDIEPRLVGGFLQRASRCCAADAIVRITPCGEPNPAVTRELTAAFVRAHFPQTANVQLSRRFFDLS